MLALLTQLRRWSARARAGVVVALAALGVFGAALFFGDSMITPAISVLAAVEGMEIVQPSLAHLVAPITAAIIVALFALQHRGTGTIGRLFGPVMVVWFVAIGAVGVRGIAEDPAVLRALLPSYALGFWSATPMSPSSRLPRRARGHRGRGTLRGHGSLRAALDHPGLAPYRLPGLHRQLPGPGGTDPSRPEPREQSVLLLAPDWGRVLLATAATVIASQAVISGTYSVTSQAAQLGYLPRLHLAHTSESRIGQVYVPSVNWLLMVAVLVLVFAFRSSTGLAYAFGTAVAGTITITTLLFFAVARLRWRTPPWLLAIGAIPLLLVDLLFFSATLTKVRHGAWIPLTVAVVVFTVMTTWRRGQAIVTAERSRQEGSLMDFIARLRSEPVGIVEGTAIYLNRGKQTAPLALHTNVGYQQVRHQRLLIVSIETEPVPRVPNHQSVTVDDLGPVDRDRPPHDPHGIQGGAGPARRTRPARPGDHRRSRRPGAGILLPVPLELEQGEATMARWRKRLFIATSRATASPTGHFHLPRDRTAIVGSRIAV